MDLSGTAKDLEGKIWESVSPYSHDADAPPPIPESSTGLLFLFGMIGMVIIKKK